MKLVHADASVQLDPGNSLRLAIVADTHSQPHPKMHAYLRKLEPHAILHAGDIGDLEVLDGLAKIARVIAVRGNIDDRASNVPDVITLDIRANGDSVFRVLLLHIAVHGPKIRADAARLAAQHQAKLIVCGHSHVPFVGRDRGLTVFNPGSIGPRRMHLPIVFGMLEITGGKLSLKHFAAETGEAWAP